MAVVDPNSTENQVYRALEMHLRAMSVPEDQWLRVQLYVRLDSGVGAMAASLSVEDTGNRSMAFLERRAQDVTSLTDTGVQTGQLAPPTQEDLTSAWQDRALRAERERDNWEYQASQMKSDLQRYFGEQVRSVKQAYLAHDQIVGEREAAIQQRDEASALALRSLELLRMVPTASMSEDVEVMHHALVADPRTRETEALLQGFLSATVDRRASDIARDRLAEAEDKQRMFIERVERVAGDATAEIMELRQRLGRQRARGWCEMGIVMVLGIMLIGWLA